MKPSERIIKELKEKVPKGLAPVIGMYHQVLFDVLDELDLKFKLVSARELSKKCDCYTADKDL